MFNLTVILELGLDVLLAATLGYCILLERRLAAVRRGQEGLKIHIGELNMAIAGAGASLRALKAAAGEAASTLDERLKRARLHIDELSVLTASGERIAQRMERSSGGNDIRPTKPMPAADLALPSSSILSRLEKERLMTGLKNRYLRLLPGVVMLGAVVLVLRTTDLVHSAYAQVSDAANSAIGGGPAAVNADYAGNDDDQIASASQVDVLSSMARRRKEQDARQSQLDTQANMLAAAEQRVDTKITQLKQLQAQITALLGQRDDAQKAQVTALVKTYSSMKPASAARIFNTMPDEVMVPVAEQMKSDVLAAVLSSMDPAAAQKLTVKLASKLTLPQTVDALAPTPAAAPGAPAATPPAGQTASAAPATTAAPAAAAPAKTGG